MAEKVIEGAKKQDRVFHVHRRDARVESRRLLGEANLSFKETFQRIKQINANAGTISGNNMVFTPLHVPRQIRDLVDTLVAKGYYPNRAEFYREAIIELVKSWGINPEDYV